MTSTELIKALRSKESRDNRELLDAAADEIENLHRERDEAIRECLALKKRLEKEVSQCRS